MILEDSIQMESTCAFSGGGWVGGGRVIVLYILCTGLCCRYEEKWFTKFGLLQAFDNGSKNKRRSILRKLRKDIIHM